MNLKKPKFWDYKKPNLLAYLLLPISYLIRIFNYFNSKIAKKNNLKIKTVCVGNFYLGGTGKTSLSIKINKILKQRQIRTCFIKKKYKDQIDEQKILKNEGKLYVNKMRINAISQAEKENFEVAICDDGLQDKSVDYDLKFVCFNTINWVGNGLTLPAGPLRERLNNLNKYEHVFLNGNLENIEKISYEINKINPNINIHLGKYEPTNLNEFKSDDKYLIFSGIGNHKTFVEMLKNYGLNIKTDIEFPDHYKYSEKDISKIIDKANELNCEILTTEKDFIRIDYPNKNKLKFLKSELKIIDEEKLIKYLI
ncbi:tetraacyldisaccharide 4'-kinase [Candidatus Pelagibacter sp. HIMB1509]|uniref:tetraacyldisaccharide 4'-kinase n=1 Tax=Candidatus Pelagibacter sp. HIMB1509 TaxID=3413339 RepID=UPI003F8402AC